jgi:ABC-type branched-subunit amino acid transport system ATPase component
MLAVGRELIARPALLMLDEPSLGLAPLIVAEIFHVLERLKRGGTSILVVGQNARPVFEIAHRVSVLERGRAVMAGSPTELVDDARVIDAYLGVADRKPMASSDRRARPRALRPTWRLKRIYELFPKLQILRDHLGTQLSGGEQQMEAYIGMTERAPGSGPAARADRAPVEDRGPSHG